jgi:hypothetical protein
MNRLAIFTLALTLSFPFSKGVAAEDIAVKNTWARATTSAIRTSAVYGTFKNTSSETLVLVKADTPVSEKVELHTNTVGDFGQMMMHPVDAVNIPAGGEAVFSPGGYHIMLVGLEQPLSVGHEIPVTLTFKNGYVRTFRAKVEPLSFRGYPE